MKKRLKVFLAAAILLLLAILIIISSGTRVFSDWLWFDNLGFLNAFMVMFFTNFWIRIAIGLIFTLFIYINLRFTKKPLLSYIKTTSGNTSEDNVENLFNNQAGGFIEWLNNKRLNYIYILTSIILGFLFSSIGQDAWKTVLRFFNKTSFDSTDPIFNKDIAFYVFNLPFYNFIRRLGMVLILLTLVVVGIIYIFSSGIKNFNDFKYKLSTRAKSHFTILVLMFMFIKAWDYWLKMYDLLYSSRGVAFGASYTDIHANLLGLRILMVLVIVIGLLFVYSLFRRHYHLILWGLGVWLLVSFIFSSVYPGFIQRFRVEPNEVNRESKYIGHNIDMTLEAYGLDNIRRKDFKVDEELEWDTINENQETIDNIRLWDPRPLQSTYSQLQELRQYYRFNDVDVDRYKIDGEYQQVMISGREMSQESLSQDAQTWINQSLKYTHGYGLVMSPVGKVTSDGLPEFYINDIPPKSESELEVKNGSIYYGENTNNYAITNTNTEEFHYPKGDQNVFTTYEGKGGVPISNSLRRLLYAMRFSEPKFILNEDINRNSRIMYHRNIKERVRKAAPFLEYDPDPYLVMIDGELCWIQDAYTVTDKYPYSRPKSNLGNYIRNSVKVVIDAYDGSMDYYIVDEDDPLARTYKKIFPDLFTSSDDIPDEIKSHFRYPEQLFKIQTSLYRTYHMRDPEVYYNKEDVWNIPTEIYGNNSVNVEPYYIVTRLPGEEEAEFVLMQPFTPENKNNMVAWLAARSDGEHYGKLFEYSFPKDSLVYGPRQIESRIDQHSDISQLFSLWSQRGSRVIRGNLLVIPIENSILYVEPVYVQAETSELPELKRVVVAYKDKVVMRETLELSLAAIFGEEEAVEEEELKPEEDVPGIPGTADERVQEALDIYERAQEQIKEGNWADYGDLMQELEEVLQDINSSVETNTEEPNNTEE
ncbi:MAG: UPF0182 family protein [Halanaerobiales bacterium]